MTLRDQVAPTTPRPHPSLRYPKHHTPLLASQTGPTLWHLACASHPVAVNQMFIKFPHLPSRELTYPTLGKGKSSSTCNFWGLWGYVSSLEGMGSTWFYQLPLCLDWSIVWMLTNNDGKHATQLIPGDDSGVRDGRPDCWDTRNDGKLEKVTPA